MPLYHYVCQECETDFEMLVNRGDEVECPKCESTEVEKQPSLPGIPQVKAGGSCGDPSLPPCGAPGCGRIGKR